MKYETRYKSNEHKTTNFVIVITITRTGTFISQKPFRGGWLLHKQSLGLMASNEGSGSANPTNHNNTKDENISSTAFNATVSIPTARLGEDIETEPQNSLRVVATGKRRRTSSAGSNRKDSNGQVHSSRSDITTATEAVVLTQRSTHPAIGTLLQFTTCRFLRVVPQYDSSHGAN